MAKRYTLDDGSIVEDLEVEVDGKRYRGSLKIVRVDSKTSSFEVRYGLQYHHDSSLFRHGATEQIRLHAGFVLKRMVEAELKGESAS